jgi:hypothetical protein
MKNNLRSWCRSDEHEDNLRSWRQSDENENNLRSWRQSDENEDNIRTWRQSDENEDNLDEKHSEKLLAEYLRNLNVDRSSESCCVQLF